MEHPRAEGQSETLLDSYVFNSNSFSYDNNASAFTFAEEDRKLAEVGSPHAVANTTHVLRRAYTSPHMDTHVESPPMLGSGAHQGGSFSSGAGLLSGDLLGDDVDSLLKQRKTTGPYHNPRYKAKMCRNWETKGSCPYFEKCQFAHGPDELNRWTERRVSAVTNSGLSHSGSSKYTAYKELLLAVQQRNGGSFVGLDASEIAQLMVQLEMVRESEPELPARDVDLLMPQRSSVSSGYAKSTDRLSMTGLLGALDTNVTDFKKGLMFEGKHRDTNGLATYVGSTSTFDGSDTRLSSSDAFHL